MPAGRLWAVLGVRLAFALVCSGHLCGLESNLMVLFTAWYWVFMVCGGGWRVAGCGLGDLLAARARWCAIAAWWGTLLVFPFDLCAPRTSRSKGGRDVALLRGSCWYLSHSFFLGVSLPYG
jgi:hypothetical protein